jgi:8-oxo-dGTP diphosphatase
MLQRLRTALMPGRRAAGALIFDEAGRLLLVKDWARREWGYPGGYVDRAESPLAGCVREIGEEIGLVLAPERFIELGTHEWRRPLGNLAFTTFAVVATTEEASHITLQRRELSHYQWVEPANILAAVAPRLRGRVEDLLATYHQRSPK